MNINVKHIPQTDEIEVRGHDCLEDGHVLEETEFINEYIVWDKGNPDVDHTYAYGMACKYCDYLEAEDDYEYGED